MLIPGFEPSTSVSRNRHLANICQIMSLKLMYLFTGHFVLNHLMSSRHCRYVINEFKMYAAIINFHFIITYSILVYDNGFFLLVSMLEFRFFCK